MGNGEGNKKDGAKEGLTFPRVRTHHEIAPCSTFSQGFTKTRKGNGCEISKVSTASTSTDASRHRHNRSTEENATLLSKPPQRNTPNRPKEQKKTKLTRALVADQGPQHPKDGENNHRLVEQTCSRLVTSHDGFGVCKTSKHTPTNGRAKGLLVDARNETRRYDTSFNSLLPIKAK